MYLIVLEDAKAVESTEVTFKHNILENKKKMLQMSYFQALSQSKREIMINISNYYKKIKKGEIEMKAS